MMERKEILELIKAEPEGFTEDKIKSFTGLPKSSLRAYLKDLIRTGDIEKVLATKLYGKGTYLFKAVPKPYIKFEKKLLAMQDKYDRDVADRWKMISDIVKELELHREEIAEMREQIKRLKND